MQWLTVHINIISKIDLKQNNIQHMSYKSINFIVLFIYLENITESIKAIY